MIGYLYIFGTIIFTVYGQIILKWRMTQIDFQLPEGLLTKFFALVKLIFDPFIFSGFVSAFTASIFWMGAMTKFELTKAYPFMSISPALVFLIGIAFMGETFTWGKILGLLLIVSGTIITVKF